MLRKFGLDNFQWGCWITSARTQPRAYIFADNKLALNAGWDEEALAAELRDPELEGRGLERTWFYASGTSGKSPSARRVWIETFNSPYRPHPKIHAWADQKLITLDQDGNLHARALSPKGFKVLAKAELLTNLSWRPPTLVGTRLYIRDRISLMAVDLGLRRRDLIVAGTASAPSAREGG